MANLEIYNSTSKTSDFNKLSLFLANEGIEIGKFQLNNVAKKFAELNTLSETEREELLQSYKGLTDKYSKLSGFRRDVVCLFPEFEHIDFVLNKFGDVHYHYENEYWYFIDGCFGFVFLGENGLKYNVSVEAGEYLQVPEGKWQYFFGKKEQRMKAMRFFNSTGKMLYPKEFIF